MFKYTLRNIKTDALRSYLITKKFRILIPFDPTCKWLKLDCQWIVGVPAQQLEPPTGWCIEEEELKFWGKNFTWIYFSLINLTATVPLMYAHSISIHYHFRMPPPFDIVSRTMAEHSIKKTMVEVQRRQNATKNDQNQIGSHRLRFIIINVSTCNRDINNRKNHW